MSPKPPVPPATPGRPQRLQVEAFQRIVVHDSGPHAGPAGDASTELPLLLVHSVNATASAYEMSPLVRRYAAQRRVVAIDLPGFGDADKPDRHYTPPMMVAAIVAAIDWIGTSQPMDVVALSLGAEFAAEAVLQRPAAVRSLALISPTGMERKRAGERYENGRTREQAWLRRLLRDTPLGQPLYRLLTTRPSIRWFLRRTWGGPHFDRGLLEHGHAGAAALGAHHAPLDFISGALFTRGVIERYRQLPVPVWVCHGKRGAFTDFGACPERSAGFAVERTAFDGGAMPHFEQPDAFDAAYFRFLRRAVLVNGGAVHAAIDVPAARPANGLQAELRHEPH